MAPFSQLENTSLRRGHLFDVLVLGHHPVAAVVEATLSDRLLAPPDRRYLSQLSELFDRQLLDVAVRIQEVESVRQVGGWHDRALLNMTCSSASKTRLHRRQKAQKHPRLSD